MKIGKAKSNNNTKFQHATFRNSIIIPNKTKISSDK